MSLSVEHLVVLMLENRSFDHMLGFLKTPGIEGLTGNEAIPTDPTLSAQGEVERVGVFPITNFDGYVTSPDCEHEFDNVTTQLFGTSIIPNDLIPHNSGFILNYSKALDRRGVPIGPSAAKTIMGCFDPISQLPVLSTLAQNYVVCDHWFSSVPGPTWPNRFFAHCATSNGHIDSPSSLEAIKDVIGYSTYGMRTIYENIMEKGLSWKIYFHDIPQSLALINLHKYLDDFVDFDQFEADAKSGKLPTYSFIEPRYFNAPGKYANDQHPPHDVREGEKLISAVYNALRQGPKWEQTLFVLLYDETGGFYDHVPPPSSINPDGRMATERNFSFNRLGFRVPAILISPLVGQGIIDHTIYDHTSLLASAKVLFELPRFLTKRDSQANIFLHLLNEDNLSLDRLPSIQIPTNILAHEVSPLAYSSDQLTLFQDSLVKLSSIINRPTYVTTEHSASAHVIEQLDIAKK